MRGRIWILPVLLGLLAALATGCGSSAGGASGRSGDAAGVVPADALAYVTVDTDLHSAQLQNAQAILTKLPAGAQLLAKMKASLANGADLNALLSSAGPVLDLAALKVDGKTVPVGFAQPSDAKTFEQQLAAGSKPPVVETIAGWTVFSDSQAALDAVSKRAGNLSDDPAYRAAIATLPAVGDAIARAYVAPSALATLGSSLGSSLGSLGAATATTSVKWVAAAATATSGGAVKIEVHAKGLPATAGQSSSSLADQIPSGALVAASFDGSGFRTTVGSAGAALGQASKAAGFDVAGLVQALSGPVIAFVRSGVPLPEVTIASKPADPAAAAKAVGALLLKVSKTATPATPAVVDGVTLDHVSLGAVDVYYGTFDGELVVSDSTNAVTELKGAGDRLSSDPTFQAAKSGSGLPDANDGWVYVNVKDALPLLDAVAQLTGTKVPSSLTANLKSVGSVVAYGSHAGDVQTLVLYLQTA